MIEKIIKGTGARGLAEYLLAIKDHSGKTRPRHDIIGGTLAGQSARQLAAEIGVLRRMRPNLNRAVGHVSLRTPEGERELTDDEWAAIGDQWAAEMGMDSYTTVCHGDHIHILFSRINSDGSVVSDSHDFKRGEAAVRRIERDFNLINVESSPLLEPENAVNHKKAPTKGDFIAMENGEVPARLFMQNTIDALIEKKPTISKFIDDLETLGVVIEPSIAKNTDKFNGFAYHYGGYRFTSNSLGRGYSLGNLQKKGLSYEPDRDIEKLRETQRGSADFVSSRRPGNDPTSKADAGRTQQSTGVDSTGDSLSIGTPDDATDGRPENTDSIRADRSSTTADTGRAGHRDGGSSDISTTEPDQEPHGANQPDANEHQGYTESDPAYKPASIRPGQHLPQRDNSDGTANQRGRSAETKPVENGGNVDAGRNNRRSNSNGWNSRFKQASAAKRAQRSVGTETVAERNTNPKRCSDGDRIRAREIDPTPYLESRGYTVERQGRHLSVLDGYYDEIYRGTQQSDGHFVWCDHYQNGVGDNIQLVREIDGSLKFTEAVYQLTGAPTLTPRPTSLPVPRVPPKLPTETRQNRDTGREYLRGRGISESTLKSAELDGMVRYCDGGILFVGYDGRGFPQNVTRRSINPDDELQKRDLKGSSKYYPPILSGGGTVWIVEGGADALALRDIAIRKKQPPPTVIVSGGANVKAFLQNPEIVSILTYSDRVIVACDNEKDDAVQERTDAAHAKQAALIEQIAGHVELWKPRAGIKDIAELNQEINQSMDVSTEQVKPQSIMRMD